jgi:hypothetical protein
VPATSASSADLPEARNKGTGGLLETATLASSEARAALASSKARAALASVLVLLGRYSGEREERSGGEKERES